MIERLLIPAWNAPPRSMGEWEERFEQLGHAPLIDRDDPEETWLILDAIGTRLLAVIEGAALAALHAEIDASDPSPALELLERAARDLNWEVHDTEDDDDEGA
ncbi:hypothetical protein [Tautonia marina]|uniref:hypothetical protein n=1 Tax=Tautonia marina TaxID=2653855 RepID=UPI001260E88F|nr:hypothetical protein [Tautonia marina]